MEKLKSSLDVLEATFEDNMEALDDDVGWDSSTVTDLTNLLSDSLHTCFQTAIKQIVENGYTNEVAESTVLKCGPFYGLTDMVSSIVDRALNFLNNKPCHVAKWPEFENLNTLVEYMIFEMVTMYRKIKPSLSVREAMWTLLICGLNVLDASEADLDPQKFSIRSLKRVKDEGSLTKPEPEPVYSSVSKSASDSGKKVEENCQCCNKRCLGHRQNNSRKKTFEKPYKGRMSKRALKARITGWGELTIERKPSSSKLSKITDLPLNETKEKTEVKPKPEPVPPEPEKTADYYLAGIPFDESKGEHVPQDEKDEMILAGVSKVESLQKEVKIWDEWANLKVMQVAKRLSHDRNELSKLRAEKEEVEKLIKDKKANDESKFFKLGEVTGALNATNYNIEMANLSVKRLESDKLVIKQEKEKADIQSLNAAKNLEEFLRKEKDALKMSESFGSEKSLLEEELKLLKREVAPKQRDLEKAKCCLKETETRLLNEKKETAKFLEQVDSIKSERKRLQALAKKENEIATTKADNELKKLESEITRIQDEIAALKLEAERKKIAAMRMGMNWQPSDGTSQVKLSGNEGKNGNMSRKKDRECVMCLCEEMRVVFVPCGHQVVCAGCNDMHEKKGMKECPSCRTIIQRRIVCRFAKS
ncbi:putative E3 ubiquitin-protein ligase RF298 [Rutidosis leptorrhynchoides]|uniref:putative E3 ubiquitin-protein ligase RF298 n=1 Tax=Rutidosis leptorrhynchoides TaxID=125765 RepID=UPI003A99EECA